MEESIYERINHIKYVSKKTSTFEKILATMSKLDTVANLDADKLRKLLSGMIQNQLLELSDNVYKVKGKDTIKSALPEISEEQMVNREKVPRFLIMTLNPYLVVMISQLTGKNVIEDHFTKIEDTLIDLQTQQFSSKNKKALNNVQNSERDLVIDILKRVSLI